MRDVWIVLIGVIAGALLSAFIQTVIHRLAKRQRRQHLILVMCAILDDFCSDCRDAMDEEGDKYTDKGRFVVPTPTAPAFPAEVDWTTVDQDLPRRILALRPAMRRAETRMAQNWDDWSHPPDYPDVFAFRREKCSEWLGEALGVSTALRKKAKPPIWEADTDG